MMKDKRAVLPRTATMALEILLPLVIAGLFYYLYCPDVFFARGIDTIIGSDWLHIVPCEGRKLYYFFRNYCLDFIWAFSFSVSVRYFTGSYRWMSAVIPVVFGGAFELLQKANVFPGTFDYYDILAEAIGTALAYIIIYFQEVMIYEKSC